MVVKKVNIMNFSGKWKYLSEYDVESMKKIIKSMGRKQTEESLKNIKVLFDH